MSNMSNVGRFVDFSARLGNSARDWYSYVGNPYIDAYSDAYEKYNKTIADQKQADKDAGDLFITAASVVTGSVLLGTIGSSTLNLLKRKAIAQIARTTLSSNMGRMFRVARRNEAVVFALGSVTDAIKGQAKAKIQTLAETYMTHASFPVSSNPTAQHSAIQRVINDHQNLATKAALAIEEDSSLSEKDKNAAYDLLRQAPIYNSPVVRAPAFKGASLAELIELTFYLSGVLDSDSLVSWPASNAMAGDAGMFADTRRAKSSPINISPNDPKYPNPAVPRTSGMGYTPAYQSVAIDRAGGTVQKRTNELCVKAFNKPLYSSMFFGMMGPADTEKTTELRQADTWLTTISNRMKPLNPLDAIV
jgi:hypothetical protein